MVHRDHDSSSSKSNGIKYKFINEGEGEGGDGDGEETLCIRANQGHSIAGICFDELLTLIAPDELKDLTIIHGTNKDAWEVIKQEGLHKMKRNHIHFASGLPDGDGVVVSGMRKTCQVHIYINGAACALDGIKFYKSDNGVILTAGAQDGLLPCRYFASVVDAKTLEELLESKDETRKRSRE